MNKKLLAIFEGIDQGKLSTEFHHGRFFTIAKVTYINEEKRIIAEGVARRSILAPYNKNGKPERKSNKAELPILLQEMSKGRAIKSLLMKLNHEIPRHHYMG